MTTRISDLPTELVEKILTRTPITSLKAVRSTSKLWNTCLTKDWILGKEAAMQQFVGFMTMDSKVCSIRFDLCRKEDEDLIDLSIKQVDILNQFEISKVFHCDGLLLCVAKNNSRLLVWNPYLGQTKWIGIGLRTNFHILYNYAFGYDINCNHKILRSLYDTRNDKYMYQIHDLSSESWKVLDVTPTWKIQSYQRWAALKGNTYFLAFWKIKKHGVKIFFLLCFDFTRERFGPRLPLPFHSAYIRDTVTLSCVRKEHLAVLYQENKVSFNILQIWVTTRIEPNDVSWSKFLNVEMRPFELTGVRFNEEAGSFFIIEEEKVAVVFDVDRYLNTDTARYHTAFIIGEDGYFKSVSLGEAPAERCPTSRRSIICPPLVCSSSYLPSLVQLNKPRKRKEKDY